MDIMQDDNVGYIRYYLNNNVGSALAGHRFFLEIIKQKWYPYIARKGFTLTFSMEAIRQDFFHFLGFVTMIRYIEEQTDIVMEYWRLRKEVGMTVDQALLVCANYQTSGWHSILGHLGTLKNLSGFSFKKHFFDKPIVRDSIEYTIWANKEFFNTHYNTNKTYFKFTPEIYKQYLVEPEASETPRPTTKGSAYEILAA